MAPGWMRERRATARKNHRRNIARVDLRLHEFRTVGIELIDVLQLAAVGAGLVGFAERATDLIPRHSRAEQIRILMHRGVFHRGVLLERSRTESLRRIESRRIHPLPLRYLLRNTSGQQYRRD